MYQYLFNTIEVTTQLLEYYEKCRTDITSFFCSYYNKIPPGFKVFKKLFCSKFQKLFHYCPVIYAKSISFKVIYKMLSCRKTYLYIGKSRKFIYI